MHDASISESVITLHVVHQEFTHKLIINSKLTLEFNFLKEIKHDFDFLTV